MGIEKYKVPLCMVDGVEFALDDAPEVRITVRMPIQANKKFAFGWAKRLPMRGGEIDASPFDVVLAQRAELFENQIIKIEGVSNPGSFWDDYPLAMEEIWEKVQDELPKYQKTLESEAKN